MYLNHIFSFQLQFYSFLIIYILLMSKLLLLQNIHISIYAEYLFKTQHICHRDHIIYNTTNDK